MTIGGNHVCITPGHTTGGFRGHGAGAKAKGPLYYHGGLLVPPVGSEAETTKILTRLRDPDGGFTYDPRTDAEPTEGFALSVHPERSKVFASASEVTKQALAEYTIKNWDLLSQSGNHIGGWNDPQTGKVYLDVATVKPTAAEAEALALNHDQIAYFDLKAGKSIDVNRAAKSGQG